MAKKQEKEKVAPPSWNTGDLLYNKVSKKTGHYMGRWAVGRLLRVTNNQAFDTGRRGEWVWVIVDNSYEDVWPRHEVEWVSPFIGLCMVQGNA